jgi:metal-sulfur cluster biosynthetic enzyme
MVRGAMTETDIRDALREVTDPELGVNIVDLGLVYGIGIDGAHVTVTMTMTTPVCPLRDYIQDLVESTIASRVSGVEEVTVDIVSDPPWTEDMMSDAARRQLA